MIVFECILLLLLIVVAVASLSQKKQLHTVIIFLLFGTIMSVLWMLLRAPDLAITEAAVGVGISGVIFILTLERIGQFKKH